MKITLNTNVFPIISVGMYHTGIDPRNIFQWEEMDEDCQEGYQFVTQHFMYYYFDMDKYKKYILEQAQDFVEEMDLEFISSLRFYSIYSPRTYNHRTDEAEMGVEYDHEGLWKRLEQSGDKFNEYLKKNFTSYDGFMSFTSNSFEEFKEEYHKYRTQEVGAALAYVNEQYTQGFFDYVHASNPSAMAMLSDEGKEILTKVEKIVQENVNAGYNAGWSIIKIIDDITLIISDYENSIEGEPFFEIKKFVGKLFKEKDNNTPKLF
jgi:hypothetical protein